MMLLISLAILVGFGASAASALGLFDLEFWWELSLLIVIMLLGHWLEMRALGQASGALDALAALLPDQAERVVGDRVETVAVGDLAVGDLVLVRPGGRVPADGVIAEGSAELDESMLTGESRPVAREPGDRVVAGTVVTDSAVRVRVDAVGEETALAGIRRLVEQAQASGSRAQALADRAAGAAVLVRPRGRARHPGRLAGPRRARPGGGADRDGAGDRLPPRPGAGHPPGHRHLDRAGGPQRHPGQGPPGPGADAHRRRGPVRQDRHPHPWPPPGHRRGDDRRDPTSCCAWPAPSRPTASTRWPVRSWPPPRPGATCQGRPGSAP